MSWVGVVCDPVDEERSTLFGGCFAWGDGRTYVTADHIVQASIERGAARLSIAGSATLPRPVTSVRRHPRLDLAVLTAEHEVDAYTQTAAPVVGQVVGSMAFAPGDGGVVSAVSRVTAVGGRRSSVSTPETRGSDCGGPDVAYAGQPIFVLFDEFDRGFSGAPVLDVGGRVLGVLVNHWKPTPALGTRSIALRFDAVLSWIEETTTCR
jgi:hypothetical protein